jgi:tetratricopeptide (TPR) repeat protein
MRVGVHCGVAVAGSIGSESYAPYGATGDTITTASRLQSVAKPGSIIVSCDVVGRTRRRFQFGPVRRLLLKGKEQRVMACELLHERQREEPASTRGCPIVGREAEVCRIADYLREMRSSYPWMVVVGAQGTGKTRIVAEALTIVPERRAVSVRGDSIAKHRPFALARQVVNELITELTGVRPSSRTAVAAAVDSLRASFHQEKVELSAEALWYWALCPDAETSAPDPDPRSLRRTVEHTVRVMLRQLARIRPTLVLFIDAYESADQASIQFLHAIGTGRCEWPLHVVIACRSTECDLPRSRCLLEIGPLSKEDAGRMLDAAAYGAALPSWFRHTILEQASGLPLLLVEMVRALIDEGILSRNGGRTRWTCKRSAADVPLRDSIRGLMAARLDRLPRSEQQVLCHCSVVGPEFSKEMAHVLHQVNGRETDTGMVLCTLEKKEVIRRLEDGRYVFCQPILRDVCYERLLFRDRKLLHAAAARAMCEDRQAGHVASPDVLAFHYEEAENWAAAARAHLEAGDHARDFGLNDRAKECYERVCGVLARLETRSACDDDLRREALGRRAHIFLILGRYAEAKDLCVEMADSAAPAEYRSEAHRLLARVYLNMGDFERAERMLNAALIPVKGRLCSARTSANVWCDVAELFLRAGRLRDARWSAGRSRQAIRSMHGRQGMLRVDLLVAKIAHMQGRFARAVGAYKRAYRAARRKGSLSEVASAANALGTVARDRGDYASAQEYFERALGIWQQLGDAECTAGAHNNLGNLTMSQGDFTRARHHHALSLKISRSIKNVQGSALAYANLAILAMENRNGRRALKMGEAAFSLLSRSGNEALKSLVTVLIGEARLMLGDTLSSQHVFEGILERKEDAHYPLARAGSLRGLGRIALAREVPGEAVRLLEQAHQAFESLTRTQEAARTQVFLAEALARAGDAERARLEVTHARERLVRIGAKQDARWAAQVMEELQRPSSPQNDRSTAAAVSGRSGIA